LGHNDGGVVDLFGQLRESFVSHHPLDEEERGYYVKCSVDAYK